MIPSVFQERNKKHIVQHVVHLAASAFGNPVLVEGGLHGRSFDFLFTDADSFHPVWPHVRGDPLAAVQRPAETAQEVSPIVNGDVGKRKAAARVMPRILDLKGEFQRTRHCWERASERVLG